MADTSLNEVIFKYFLGDDIIIPIELFDDDDNPISIDALRELYVWVKQEGSTVKRMYAKTPGTGEYALQRTSAYIYLLVIDSAVTKTWTAGKYELQFNIVENSTYLTDNNNNSLASRYAFELTDLDIKTKS